MLADSAKDSDTWQETQYFDFYDIWDNVVDAIIRILLKSFYVSVHLGTEKIMLKSGSICTLSDRFYLDSDNGYTFWKPMLTSSCSFHQCNVLYESLVTKIKEKWSKVLKIMTKITGIIVGHDVIYRSKSLFQQAPAIGIVLMKELMMSSWSINAGKGQDGDY